jgi:hypothetical protein
VSLPGLATKKVVPVALPVRLSSPAPPRSVKMFWTLPPTPVALLAERSR